MMSDLTLSDCWIKLKPYLQEQIVVVVVVVFLYCFVFAIVLIASVTFIT